MNEQLLGFCLYRVPFRLHALANHYIIQRTAVFRFRGIGLDCCEGRILMVTFGNVGIEGLRGKVLFRIELISNLTTAGQEERSEKGGTSRFHTHALFAHTDKKALL
jgi:hypothetical protein